MKIQSFLLTPMESPVKSVTKMQKCVSALFWTTDLAGTCLKL